MAGRPRFSVIIPVYDTEAHLAQCLDSVLAQTASDLELICVDDGSTDGSPAILARYAERDTRVAVITQSNAGAGAARNAGLDVAGGEYLLFLDADDHVEPQMLERMHAAAAADCADICVCAAERFDERAGTRAPADALLRAKLVPDTQPFSACDIPDTLFAFTSPAAWNKLFRAAFVTEHGLRFQEISRTNDYLFTRSALALAEAIVVVGEPLVNYRVGGGSNIQSTNHTEPLAFLAALRALKTRLVESGRFTELERAFVNDALTICLFNLDSLATADSFRELFVALQGGVLAELGIEGHAEEYFFSARRYAQYVAVRDHSAEQYLLGETRRLRAESTQRGAQLAAARAKLAAAEGRLRDVKDSRAYRFSRRLAAIPRSLGRLSTRGPEQRS